MKYLFFLICILGTFAFGSEDKKVLILGGTQFLGIHLTEEFQKQGIAERFLNET